MERLDNWRANRVISLDISGEACAEVAQGKGGRTRSAKASDYIHTISHCDTEDEKKRLVEIEKILYPTGAQNENQKGDVWIVFNADKYRNILITRDGGILKRRVELEKKGITVMDDCEAVDLVCKRIQCRDDQVRQVASMRGEALPTWVGHDDIP